MLVLPYLHVLPVLRVLRVVWSAPVTPGHGADQHRMGHPGWMIHLPAHWRDQEPVASCGTGQVW
ncbi:MAG TPA: hypothetical protein VIS06_07170 [Mycobacteriales bacterium]